MKLDEKVVFVTGGANGIGKGLCEAVLAQGGSVGFVDLNEKQSITQRDAWRTQFGADRVWGAACDVVDSVSLEAAIRQCVTFFKGRLHAVVNNAGIGEIELMQNNQKWKRVVDIDLTAVIDGTRLAVLYMRQPAALFGASSSSSSKQPASPSDYPIASSPAASVCGGHGVVINVASMAGLLPQPASVVYSAAKFGVVGFSRAMTGFNKAFGIRVNAICPSFTNTNMVQSIASTDAKYFAVVQAMGVMDVSLVAKGMLELISDEKQNGAVMRVTQKNGIDYQTFARDPAAFMATQFDQRPQKASPPPPKSKL